MDFRKRPKYLSQHDGLVNRQVESSTPSDEQQRSPDGQKFDDDVAQKEGDDG